MTNIGNNDDTKNDIVRIAVMDYDGTLSSVQTGLFLVVYLFFHGMILLRDIPKLFVWGFGYLTSQNHNLSVSREMCFNKLKRLEASEADAILDRFYDNVARRFVRSDAIEEIRKLHDAGTRVLLVSGAFENVVRQAAHDNGFDGYIAVEMERAECADGIIRYTGKMNPTDIVCEGRGKPQAVERYCDERYGTGRWHLVSAYGDHLSDRWMMERADRKVSVNGQLLYLYAKRHGWECVTWH